MTLHGDPVVQRRRQCVDGGDAQEVTTLVPKYEYDNLIFTGSRWGAGGWGSDVSCI